MAKVVTKLAVINKCSECPVYECEHRQPCGPIPAQCELNSPEEFLRENLEIIKNKLSQGVTDGN
ncbi:MAG TPA: hypothetical protein PLG20_06930 [Candidatus Syntrophosphaera sp.]|nr:hypothetical protein [Candidatus Syntrophosphaera sp.]